MVIDTQSDVAPRAMPALTRGIMLDALLDREDGFDGPRYVAPEVSYLLDKMVNVVFVGSPNGGDRSWVLVDAGLPGAATKIRNAAAKLFGVGARPSAIVLTHGHADHVGAIHTLSEEWDAPVFAHELELPYLTGRSAYPPAEPLAGGGVMTLMSVLFPCAPISLGARVSALPSDGSVPGMAGWRWIATPGHSPGHISLIRDADRVVIAGDAFVTTRQESLRAVLQQRPELHGPPRYFTPDWDAARESVGRLADYSPTAAITGHGPPMCGAELQMALRRLSSHFDQWARPSHGRYRHQPAVADARGVISVPAPVISGRTLLLSAAAIGGAIALGAMLNRVGGRADTDAADEARADTGSDEARVQAGALLATQDGGYDGPPGVHATVV